MQLVRVVASDCSFCYKGRLKSDGEGSGEEEEEKEAERAKRLGTQKPHRTAGVDAICICKILLGPISKSKQQEFPQLCFFFFFGSMAPGKGKYRDYLVIRRFSPSFLH